jgi:hypothetical protein
MRRSFYEEREGGELGSSIAQENIKYYQGRYT